MNYKCPCNFNNDSEHLYIGTYIYNIYVCIYIYKYLYMYNIYDICRYDKLDFKISDAKEADKSLLYFDTDCLLPPGLNLTLPMLLSIEQMLT